MADKENISIKVLLIEDDRLVARLIQDMLAKVSEIDCKTEWFERLAPALDRLVKNDIDVVLLDLFLPDSEGIDTLVKVQARSSGIPVLVLTGLDDESTAIKAMQAGAQDYLVKGREDVFHFIRAIRYAIERKHIQEALKKALSEMEVQVALRTSDLTSANAKLLQAYSELQETQSRFIQAAKMQVVGGLASGVAHEVKNPLAIISQGVEYLTKKVPLDDENISFALKSMTDAVMRANDIITGLLDFASLSKLDVSPHDLRTVLGNSLLLVKHQFVKNHIQLNEDIAQGIPPINIDKNRIEQVFLNLFMNSADAMPSGGTLTISMRIEKAPAMTGGAGRRKEDIFKPGEKIVLVEVEDTGIGIPQEIIDKVFDPFFTTKRGKGGTGLGLSIVKNIMEMHRGRIDITNKKEGGIKAMLMFRMQG
ncbi:MAG: ATP-binding protein [Candidatus Omnitrophica bacterium]|jgi:signal transduction histidine kinase|nr:ATP-binding protein [Candidatus Omnitrophota bacterium]